ncbi:MAG: SLATT domain-containing protein [Armatimonadota bacterium]|nr:SLATT domain-containing protein [bacterium]
MTENQDRVKILSVARELFARVAWTHKTHEKERERWSRKVRCERWLNVLLVGLTTALAVIGAIVASKTMFVVTSIVGAASTAFVIYQVSFDACGIESQHRIAAKKLVALRDRYLLFILKASTASTPVIELQRGLEALQTETSLIYESAPDTSPEAYAMTSVGLKDNEELTFSDKEIDIMLPNNLRLGDDLGSQIQDRDSADL